MTIPNNLKKEIKNYTQLNNIDNIDDFMLACLKQGFDIKKYGYLGDEPQKIIEKEIIKEVPIEIIKEVKVEVIKEIPKEVIINNESDNDKIKKIQETLQKLRNELLDKNQIIKIQEEQIKAYQEQIQTLINL